MLMRCLILAVMVIAGNVAGRLSGQEAAADVAALVSDSVISVAFAPDGQWVAGGAFDATVKLWTSRNWSMDKTLKSPSSCQNSNDPSGRTVIHSSLIRSLKSSAVRSA